MNPTAPPLPSPISIQRVEAVLHPELLFFVALLGVVSWVVYRFLLSKISPERHRNLRLLFRNLLVHSAIALVSTGLFWTLAWWRPTTEGLSIAAIIGLIAVFWSGVVLVKICRILTFEYLFFKSMRVGVPVLIVNLLSLVLSLILGLWVLSAVFDVRLAPLLATSAIFSIVLGLALQDTLGNLIAGVALQLDKPYSIGDWVEVQQGPTRWIGQVCEISWRAVNLIGFLEETITIPNRVMAQAEVANYSGKDRPFLRSQIYRVAYGSDIDAVRRALVVAPLGIPGIKALPEPIVLFYESSESYMTFKLVYSIHDYGAQFIISDQLNTKVVTNLSKEGIRLAPMRLVVEQSSV